MNKALTMFAQTCLILVYKCCLFVIWTVFSFQCRNLDNNLMFNMKNFSNFNWGTIHLAHAQQ